MIKIVHLITGLLTGGTEMWLYNLVTRMDKRRYENIVISITEGGPVAKLLEEAGVKVVSLGLKRGRVNPSAVFRLVSLLKSENPRVLQTWLYHADLFGMIANSLSVRAPMLWNLRCSKLDPKDHPVSLFAIIKILGLLSKRPVAVISNSTAGRAEHERLGYSPDRWEMIHNGFDTDLLCPDPALRQRTRDGLGVEKGEMLIGMVARYDPMKDHATFIKAAGDLRRRWPSARFALVGAGMDASNDALARMIRDNGIEAQTLLLGERRDVYKIYPAFDVGASSSYSEGFPNAIGEAMACGVPCVVTDAGDSRAIVGDAGMITPIRDPLAMADAMGKMLSMSPEKKAALGRQARDRIQERYSMNESVRRYERLYDDIAGEGATQAMPCVE